MRVDKILTVDDLRVRSVEDEYIEERLTEPFRPARSLATASERAAERRLSPPANNMGAVKYHLDYVRRQVYDGGLEVGFYGSWKDQLYADLCTRLDRAKKAADDKDETDKYIELDGRVWKVSAKGARAGGALYKYQLESAGVLMMIHSRAKGTIAPVRVRVGASCFMRASAYEVATELYAVLHSLGFTVERDVVSRVDMQILLLCDIETVTDIMRYDYIVTRARGKVSMVHSLSTGRIETMTISSHSVELCIYDKIAEVATQEVASQVLFRESVVAGRDLPESLTRVEIRLRREYLRRYGVTSLADLFSAQQALCDLVLCDWLRVLESPKVRGSETEHPVHPVWAEIQRIFHELADFRGMSSQATVSTLRGYRRIQEVVDVRALVAQAVGVLSSAVSVMSDVTSEDVVYEYIQRLIEEKKGVIYDKVLERKRDYSARLKYEPAGLLFPRKEGRFLEFESYQ